MNLCKSLYEVRYRLGTYLGTYRVSYFTAFRTLFYMTLYVPTKTYTPTYPYILLPPYILPTYTYYLFLMSSGCLYLTTGIHV